MVRRTTGVDYVFGFGGNAVLHGHDPGGCRRAVRRTCAGGRQKLRSFARCAMAPRAGTRSAASWPASRRPQNGLDVRYVVTSLTGTAQHLYETVYCGRGQAENFIKWHKAQLASDRTSCRDPRANQFRLILHTAAYWLMLTMRNASPNALPFALAEFATLRLRLIKIAARVVEGAARIRVFLPTACPDRAVFRQLAGRLCAAGP